MRRYLLLILVLLTLAVPFVLRAFASHSTPAPASSGELTLIIITPNAEAIRTEFADAFSAWHQQHFGQAVFVDYRIYGGASDIVRYFDSAKKTLFASLGTYKIDLVWGGGDDLFDRQLRKPRYLQGVNLPADEMAAAFPKPTLNGLPLYDLSSHPPQWFGTALSSFGIVYNTDVLRHLGLPKPKTWSDLCNPRYRNWLVLADPTRSGVARATFMVIVERAMQDAVDGGRSADEGWANGMGLIRQISANARLFTDNGSIVPSIVGSGDAAAGMAIDFQARSEVDALQVGSTSRLGYIEPAGATAISPDPIAMVQGAPHGELAKQFIEFILSEPGQRLWNTRAGASGGPRQSSLRRLPIMPSVYNSPVNFTDAVNPYRESAGFNTSRSRTATFGIIAELIQMSCIDPLTDLKKTRQTILASPDSAKLDAKLGRFPFNQGEALARAKAWGDADPLKKLTLQREWTDKFHQEYARLRQNAETEPQMNADKN